MENLTISSMADVRSFFYFLMVEMELGGGFHPDTPMADYERVNADYPNEMQLTFHPDFADQLQSRVEECFLVCSILEQDIYECGMELGYKLGYYPRPDDQKAKLVILLENAAMERFEMDDSDNTYDVKFDMATEDSGSWEELRFDSEKERDAFIAGMEKMDTETGGFCEYWTYKID